MIRFDNKTGGQNWISDTRLTPDNSTLASANIGNGRQAIKLHHTDHRLSCWISSTASVDEKRSMTHGPNFRLAQSPMAADRFKPTQPTKVPCHAPSDWPANVSSTLDGTGKKMSIAKPKMITEADCHDCMAAVLLASDSIAGSSHHPSKRNGIVGTASARTIIQNRGAAFLFCCDIEQWCHGVIQLTETNSLTKEQTSQCPQH